MYTHTHTHTHTHTSPVIVNPTRYFGSEHDLATIRLERAGQPLGAISQLIRVPLGFETLDPLLNSTPACHPACSVYTVNSFLKTNGEEERDRMKKI